MDILNGMDEKQRYAQGKDPSGPYELKLFRMEIHHLIKSLQRFPKYFLNRRPDLGVFSSNSPDPDSG